MADPLNAAASAPPSELFGEYGMSRTGRLVWLIVGVVMSLAVLALPVAPDPPSGSVPTGWIS